MRVIAGQYRGRTLMAPKGDVTRPTTDRVRESLFSTITSYRGGFGGAIVLDAFAGSGALGIEAISRGAVHATFCEYNRVAFDTLMRNTSFLDTDCVRIVRGDVLKRLPVPTVGSYNLVFIDPPYTFDVQDVAALLQRLEDAEALAEDILVSYEHAAGKDACLVTQLNSHVQGGLELQLETTKTYGDTVIDLYRRTAR